MAVDFTTKTPEQLELLIGRYKEAGAKYDQQRKDAIGQLGSRKKGEVSLERTCAIIAEYAKRSEFLSYSDIADAYEIPRARARLALPKHLLDVNRYARMKGWPLLSSIVVGKDHVKDGAMDEATLNGFCKAAEKMDLEVGEPVAFLKAQQEAVFAAAAKGTLG
jgi:hypothetical protein